MCRIAAFLLLVTITVTGTYLLRDEPWYYYACAGILIVACALGYNIAELWFERRRRYEALNPGHFNEVADRSDCLLYIVNDVLTQHPAVQNNETWKELCQQAEYRLAYITKFADNLGNNDIVIFDRAVWFFEMVNCLLVENSIIANDPEALKHAQAAADKLWDLYQDLGKKYEIKHY